MFGILLSHNVCPQREKSALTQQNYPSVRVSNPSVFYAATRNIQRIQNWGATLTVDLTTAIKFSQQFFSLASQRPLSLHSQWVVIKQGVFATRLTFRKQSFQGQPCSTILPMLVVLVHAIKCHYVLVSDQYKSYLEFYHATSGTGIWKQLSKEQYLYYCV